MLKRVTSNGDISLAGATSVFTCLGGGEFHWWRERVCACVLTASGQTRRERLGKRSLGDGSFS